jgi:hypothetical protein
MYITFRLNIKHDFIIHTHCIINVCTERVIANLIGKLNTSRTQHPQNYNIFITVIVIILGSHILHGWI